MRKSHTHTHTPHTHTHTHTHAYTHTFMAHTHTHAYIHTHSCTPTHTHTDTTYTHTTYTHVHTMACAIAVSCKCRNLLSLHELINSSILQVQEPIYRTLFFNQRRSRLHFTNAVVTYKMQEPAPFLPYTHTITQHTTHAHIHTIHKQPAPLFTW